MKLSRTILVCIAVLSLGRPAYASIATAPAPAAESEAKPKVTLELDTTKLDSTGESIEKRLKYLTKQHASDANVELVADSDAVLRVVVWPSGAKKLGYEFSIVPLLAGKPVEAPDASGVCSRCVPEDIVQQINAHLPAQLAALKAEMEKPAPPVASRVVDPVPPVHTAPPRGADTKRKPGPLGAMGWAGVGVGLGGLAAVVAGVVVATREPKSERGSDIEVDTQLDARKPMIGVAALGGAMVVTGIVLIAVDRGKARRKATALAPMMLPRGAGISLGMQF